MHGRKLNQKGIAMMCRKVRSVGRRCLSAFAPGCSWITPGVLVVTGVLLGAGGPRTDEALAAENASPSVDDSLVGYWKLHGDCRDHSGNGNHGVDHGVDLEKGEFNGRGAYVEVPSGPSLNVGKGDFSLCAWVCTKQDLEDVVGDVLSKYDPAKRNGFTLSIKASSGGYQSQGNDKHVHFGIDNGQISEWEDCGRPNPTSNYASNTVVFRGKLYAATYDAKNPKDWAHVYRYEGGRKWTDCGRLGDGKTTGVGPMIVHDGNLYAATGTYDWTRILDGGYDCGRVYRYEGGDRWTDCGQPGDNRRLPTMASFQGKLYVGAGNERSGIFVYEGGQTWRVSKEFSQDEPRRLFPHAMGVHDGKLYVGFPDHVYVFDGKTWTYAGNPVGCTQVHSLEVHQGDLYTGTWPEAKVARYRGGEDWEYRGRIGEDGTEVNALTVYNGKLYAGAIPRAEVRRYEGAESWTSLGRFFSPPGWEPIPVKSNLPDYRKRSKEWTRATSLTVYEGRLFVTIASCTSSVLDAPCDVRGTIFSMEAGKCLSYDDDLGSGWKHLAAVREGDRLKLYLNGRLVTTSTPFRSADYDLSNDQPLRIGFGEMDYFSGNIREVRMYKKALNQAEIDKLSVPLDPVNNRNP